jgi:hypothetical protein
MGSWGGCAVIESVFATKIRDRMISRRERKIRKKIPIGRPDVGAYRDTPSDGVVPLMFFCLALATNRISRGSSRDTPDGRDSLLLAPLCQAFRRFVFQKNTSMLIPFLLCSRFGTRNFGASGWRAMTRRKITIVQQLRPYRFAIQRSHFNTRLLTLRIGLLRGFSHGEERSYYQIYNKSYCADKPNR